MDTTHEAPHVAVLLPLTSHGPTERGLWLRLEGIARELQMRGHGCHADVFVGVDDADRIFKDEVSEGRLSEILAGDSNCTVRPVRHIDCGTF